MPTNGTTGNNPSGTLTSNSESSPKKTKARSSKKAGGATPTRRASSGTRAAAAASNEILFTTPPNPYVTPEPPYIWIDHPEEGERLLGPVYVIRMGVGGAEAVELSIDGGVWKDCRLTSGYWWYDWAAIRPGRHTLTARMRTEDGRWLRTPPRSVEFRP